MTPKKPILTLGLAGMLMAGTASAELMDEDMLKVTVHIEPSIAVKAGQDAELSALQTGEVEGALQFRIDSNSQEIDLSVQASHLYKGGDPNSEYILQLSQNGGAVIHVVGGNPTQYTGQFNSQVNVYSGFMGYGAEPVRMESGDSGRFSNDLEIDLTWNNDEDALPVGDYIGYVKVIGVVVPDGGADDSD